MLNFQERLKQIRRKSKHHDENGTSLRNINAASFNNVDGGD